MGHQITKETGKNCRGLQGGISLCERCVALEVQKRKRWFGVTSCTLSCNSVCGSIIVSGAITSLCNMSSVVFQKYEIWGPCDLKHIYGSLIRNNES
jgi:hypothetical protein